jgi:hypothetical protein
VRLTDLYEPNIDSSESEEYLSSISELVATGQNFNVKILPYVSS